MGKSIGVEAREIAEQLKSFFRESYHSNRRISAISLLIALIAATSSVDLSPRYIEEITITATGNRPSVSASGSEVWLERPTVIDLELGGFDVLKSAGWELKNGIFISRNHQPAELRIKGMFPREQTVDFLKHAYSGEAEIETNGKKTSVDLFQIKRSLKAIHLTGYFSETDGSYLHTFHEYLAEFTKYFLLFMSLFIAFNLILLKVPVPENNVANRTYLALVTACVFLLFLLAYYPGVISVDGYQQYYQAVNFRFDDWHPPIMSALWGLLDKIARGSQGMFLLQIVMAVYSAYLLSRTALSKQKKFWFIPVLALLLPVVCNLLFVIWKDVSLTVSLFFAFSTWYSWRASGKLTKPRLALILAAIFYGSAVRHNALPATIPLLFIILLDYVSARKALALAVLCSGLFYMGNSFIVYRILNAGKSHFFQIVVNHDLMGIYEITKKNYFPENTLSKTQLDKLMQKFDHSNLDPTTFSEDSFSTSDPEIQSALRKRWLTAIMENPSAYLKHRWILYRDFLTKIVFILIPYSGPPPENVSDMPKPCMEEGFLARTNHAYVYWARYHYGFVYKTITYLIASTVILIYSIRRKLVTPAALSASSLLYIAPYFFVAPAVNYRYIYWSVFATILSLIVLWIENYGEGRPVESH